MDTDEGNDLTMPWMMVDDQMHGHRKFVKLGQDRWPATGLWATAGSWVAGAMTDGFVPDYVVQQWDPDFRLAKRLVQVGLWVDATHDGETGYQFHDWTEINRSREQIVAERAYNTRRTALHRDPKLTATVRMRDEGRCRYCGVLVNWTDRRGITGATYDHIDPNGANTLDNVVVACRGCNSSKAGRTPEGAGMELLPAGSTGPSGPKPPGGATVRKPPRTVSAPAPTPVSSSDLDPYLDTTHPGVQTLSDLPIHTYPHQVVKKTPPLRGIAAAPRTARATAGPEFEEFYAAYPRRVEPQDAARAYLKAIKTTTHRDLMIATRRFAIECREREKRFIPYPASWLNAGGYESEPDRDRRVSGLNDY